MKIVSLSKEGLNCITYAVVKEIIPKNINIIRYEKVPQEGYFLLPSFTASRPNLGQPHWWMDSPTSTTLRG